MDNQKLFVRRTTSTETEEGLQQSNINVFIYESVEFAWTYFSEIMNEEEWKKLLETGEGFYKVKGEGYDNYIFIETRKVSI
tara:strand:- start:3230 stop:3472 length:243 start_codon:yes stop_codon:yes gene_type:complete